MFECVITVEGNGEGKYGRFKNDKTGPVSQFMVDNIALYPIVKRHVLSCDKCDPTEALQYYLNRRLTLEKFQPRQLTPGVSFGGTVNRVITVGLAKVALSYERKSKLRPVSSELINEFIWRTADFQFLTEHQFRLSVRNLIDACQLVKDTTTNRKPTILSTRVRTCWEVVNNATSLEDLEDLVKVAEVMLA